MFNKRFEGAPTVAVNGFSESLIEQENYATRKTVVAASIIPAAASIGLVVHRYTSDVAVPVAMISEPINVVSNPAIVEPLTLAEAYTRLPVTATPSIPQQTGIIADTSLEMLATILDPVVQIMVAISFPIASVIMIGACFFFMVGNNEKAWSMIMNAGLGYVLIQLSPLFLEILREVGEAI